MAPYLLLSSTSKAPRVTTPPHPTARTDEKYPYTTSILECLDSSLGKTHTDCGVMKPHGALITTNRVTISSATTRSTEVTCSRADVTSIWTKAIHTDTGITLGVGLTSGFPSCTGTVSRRHGDEQEKLGQQGEE